MKPVNNKTVYSCSGDIYEKLNSDNSIPLIEKAPVMLKALDVMLKAFKVQSDFTVSQCTIENFTEVHKNVESKNWDNITI